MISLCFKGYEAFSEDACVRFVAVNLSASEVSVDISWFLFVLKISLKDCEN